jgi:hypothetical protein
MYHKYVFNYKIIVNYYTAQDISTWITFVICFADQFADRSNCTNLFCTSN